MNRTDAICLLVVILIIVGIVSALTYSWYQDISKTTKKKETTELIARNGDLVTFDFTEYIWTKDTNGTLTYAVYQTTSEAVAEDDTIPKSVTFKSILITDTNASIVRETGSAIVGNDLSIEINPGFNKLLLKLNMKIGETKSGEVSIEDGYGQANESLVHTIPFKDTIPMYESVDRFLFEGRHPNEKNIEPGLVLKDHYWNWDITVKSVTDDTVEIQHQPTIGQKIDLFPWESSVVNVSSNTGLIWIQHIPDQSLVNTDINAEEIEFYNPTFSKIREAIYESQQPYPGIILSVDNGITIDFNRENIGKNLRYDITIIDISRD